MPLIACPGCRSVFNANLEMIGRKTRCPKCRTVFVATAKMSGPRRKQSSQAPYWVGGSVVLVVGLIFLITQAGADPEQPPARAESSAGSAAGVSTPETGGGPGPEAGPPPSAPEEGSAKARAERIMRAIEEDDLDNLISRISFVHFHEKMVTQELATQRWNDLDFTDRALAREAITERVFGGEEQKNFLSTAQQTSLVVISEDARNARVQVMMKSVLGDQGSEAFQERTLELINVSGNWYLAWMDVGEITNPALSKARSEEHRAEERKRRSERSLGEVAAVDYQADTSAELRAEMDQLIAAMRNIDEPRDASRARRRLEEIGKPAIPALLNLAAERAGLSSHDDLVMVNQAVQGLQAITQLDFGFSPGGLAGSLTGESLANNTTALRRWFGWWQENKVRWNGPPPPDEDEES